MKAREALLALATASDVALRDRTRVEFVLLGDNDCGDGDRRDGDRAALEGGGRCDDSDHDAQLEIVKSLLSKCFPNGKVASHLPPPASMAPPPPARHRRAVHSATSCATAVPWRALACLRARPASSREPRPPRAEKRMLSACACAAIEGALYVPLFAAARDDDGGDGVNTRSDSDPAVACAALSRCDRIERRGGGEPPRRRRFGAGSALCRALLEVARTKHCSRVLVPALVRPGHAKAFWLEMGFKPVTSERDRCAKDHVKQRVVCPDDETVVWMCRAVGEPRPPPRLPELTASSLVGAHVSVLFDGIAWEEAQCDGVEWIGADHPGGRAVADGGAVGVVGRAWFGGVVTDVRSQRLSGSGSGRGRRRSAMVGDVKWDNGDGVSWFELRDGAFWHGDAPGSWRMSRGRGGPRVS
jgi:GNAT superfamily N-acetyltransferase